MIPTFSPQGDGNHPVPEPDPAGLGAVDPYLFPARGRKRLLGHWNKEGDGVDPYLFPARGRKLEHPRIVDLFG